MRSMTGYGSCRLSRDGREITVELKSVNHRYLDINMRMYRSLSFAEDALRGAIGKMAARGHFEVYVNYRNLRQDARTVEVNAGLAQAYGEALRQLHEAVPEAREDLTITALARMPDVLTVTEAQEDQQAVTGLIVEAAQAAMDQLNGMRLAEGARLEKDFAARLTTLKDLLEQVKLRAPGVVTAYRDKLNARIEELLDRQAEPQRVAQEVAFFADKCAIDEETVRLDSHIGAFRAMLGQDVPSGKQLDFLVQEMNREVNTIGSKASDLELTNRVLAMKNEIEKIREQVQNIE